MGELLLGRHRRLLSLVKLLVSLLFGLSAVDSFVLRRRSVVAESDDVDRLIDADNARRMEVADALTSLERLQQQPVGGGGRYDARDDDDADDDVSRWAAVAATAAEPEDEDDYGEEQTTADDELTDGIQLANYDDFEYDNRMLNNDNDADEGEQEVQEEAEAEDTADDVIATEKKISVKTPLDKEDLKQLFETQNEATSSEDGGAGEDAAAEAAVTSVPASAPAAGFDESTVKSDGGQKTELTKNEVEQLFEKVADDELEKTVKAAEATATEPNASKEVALPTSVVAKAMAVEQLITDGVAELSPGGANDDAVGDGEDSDTLLDVKEETIWPQDGEKLTKEWMVALEQPEEDDDSTRWSGGRKFRRSPVVSGDDADGDDDGGEKQRAVELLKAYIELQEDENRHLTEALNLATLAQQNQRTDLYIGPQIEQLRQAVGDEQAIQAIRQMIRSEEDRAVQRDGQELSEDEGEEDDDEEPIRGQFIDKRQHDNELVPLVDDTDTDDDEEEEEDIVEPTSSSAEKNRLLQEKLRQYVLNQQLSDILEDEGPSDDDELSSLDEPEMDTLAQPPPANENIYIDPRLNPFTRDIEYLYRHRAAAKKPIKRFGPSAGQRFELAGSSDWEDDERKAALATAQLRQALEGAEEDEDDDEDDDDGSLRDAQIITEADICPAVQELTNNCLVARQRRLVLDDEAMEMCNRHQLCYLCGSQFGLTPDVCDRGYLGDVDELCSRPTMTPTAATRCHGEATGLLGIMLAGHRYAPSGYRPAICAERCAYDYIVGLASRR